MACNNDAELYKVKLFISVFSLFPCYTEYFFIILNIKQLLNHIIYDGLKRPELALFYDHKFINVNSTVSLLTIKHLFNC